MDDELKRSTIVHVDDSVDFLQMVAHKLERYKYAPIPATTPKEAIENVHELRRPCIIFIDHKLGGKMTGQALLGYFDKTTHPVSRWIYTADDRPEIEASCRLAGADGVILKQKSSASNMYLLSMIFSAEKFIRDRLGATTDPLTNMRNRRIGFEQAQNLLNLAGRDGKNVVVACGDGDNFKIYNDKYGHPMGDLVIIKMAETITGHIRDTDVAFRSGGDEFIILFYGTDLKEAKRLVRLINRQLFGEPVDVGNDLVRSSITFGYHLVKPDSSIRDLSDAIKKADTNLREAKEKKKVGR